MDTKSGSGAVTSGDHAFTHLTRPRHSAASPAHRRRLAALVDCDCTANTLSARCVCIDPHLGQAIFSFELIERTSFSNFVCRGPFRRPT